MVVMMMMMIMRWCWWWWWWWWRWCRWNHWLRDRVHWLENRMDGSGQAHLPIVMMMVMVMVSLPLHSSYWICQSRMGFCLNLKTSVKKSWKPSSVRSKNPLVGCSFAVASFIWWAQYMTSLKTDPSISEQLDCLSNEISGGQHENSGIDDRSAFPLLSQQIQSVATSGKCLDTRSSVGLGSGSMHAYVSQGTAICVRSKTLQCRCCYI